MTSLSRALARSSLSTSSRLALWVLLAIAQMAIASALFEFKAGLADHLNPVYYAVRSARWFIVAVPVFLLLVWSRRHELAASWTELSSDHRVLRPLALNLLAFTAFAAACAAFTAHAATAEVAPWHLLPWLGLLLAATAVTLLGVVAPLGGLMAFAWQWRAEALAAAAISLVVVVLADAMPLLWGSLAGITLTVSAALMQLYEPEVLVDAAARTITVGDFTAVIKDACSGIEGLALVGGFLTVYLWIFRSEFRFPAALLLYPIGFAASLFLNAVRIAALTSIGGHVSQELAVSGFHSQGGWIAFLLVTFGLMALSQGPFRRHRPSPVRVARPEPSVRERATTAHLLPFAALMLGSIVMAASAPHDRPIYVLNVILVAAALWHVRSSFAGWRLQISAEAVVAGLVVGALWIATAPVTEAGESLGRWLADIGPGLAALWLVARGVGTAVLVPVAEELAFRGYLYRRVISRDFHLVRPSVLSWAGLVVSSVLFGAMHGRWLAAALAGVVFALVMVRRGRLADAVVSHAFANALIFIWALALGQWSLL